MRIAILTSGRFHVLDLARELDRLGHQVKFYSLLPNSRTAAFGLPEKCNRSLLTWMAPFFAAQKLSPERWKLAAQHLLRSKLDEHAANRIEACDLLIGMSGLTVKAAEAVKKKYGAKVWLERGSRHIRSQKEILDAIPGLPASSKVPDVDVEREEAGYALADLIVLGSQHCVESFAERGFPQEKLFRNPYGVDLSMFSATPVPDGPRTVIMVGSWSSRKGCDVLVEAWQQLEGVRLLHVGSVDDVPLPRHPNFTHHDSVDQQRLREFYAASHVLALPSREDGFGMVMTQALSCGLPVVATDRTGGPDLAEALTDKAWVNIVPTENPAALADGIRKALDTLKTQSGKRDILGANKSQFSWQAYGERYHQEILRRFS